MSNTIGSFISNNVKGVRSSEKRLKIFEYLKNNINHNGFVFLQETHSLTQKRHDNAAAIVHWKLCGKFNLEKSEKWYLHNPQTVSENVNHKLIWDMNIQCDNVIVERRPDIAIVNKMEKTAVTIDVAIPGDKTIIDKEKEKIEKHQNIKREIRRLLHLTKIDTYGLGGSWECYKEL